jgi:MoxR-like ATPase
MSINESSSFGDHENPKGLPKSNSQLSTLNSPQLSPNLNNPTLNARQVCSIFAAMNFRGTETYIATRELQTAVNAAIHLERPLLVKGEPGTGKTLLAFEVAKSLGMEIFTWHVKSTTSAQQGLYEYDAVSRLRDSQLGDAKVNAISNYIKPGPVWKAFDSDKKVVLLIDEIDKADIEFPNDLLLELDKMEFYCYELQQTIRAKHRPVVIITSNNEKELPDAFLRRCFFHYIRFPDRETMQSIVNVHFENLDGELFQRAMDVFYNLREINGIKKRPSTSELIDWLKLLILGKVAPSELADTDLTKVLPAYSGALLKNERDLDMLLARIKRR